MGAGLDTRYAGGRLGDAGLTGWKRPAGGRSPRNRVRFTGHWPVPQQRGHRFRKPVPQERRHTGWKPVAHVGRCGARPLRGEGPEPVGVGFGGADGEHSFGAAEGAGADAVFAGLDVGVADGAREGRFLTGAVLLGLAASLRGRFCSPVVGAPDPSSWRMPRRAGRASAVSPAGA